MRPSILLNLMLATLITSCGDKDSGDSSTTTDLEGTWVTDCVALDGLSAKAKLVFAGSTAKGEFVIFSDNTCLSLLYVDNLEETFTIGDSVPSLTNTKEIDLKSVSTTRTLNDPDLVNEANASSMYGYTDWKKDEAKNVGGRKLTEADTADRDVGEVSYNIFKIDGNNLTLGDKTLKDGRTEANRPDSLQTDLIYKKQ